MEAPPPKRLRTEAKVRPLMGWQAEVDNLKSSALACSLVQAIACSVATRQHSYYCDTHLQLAACACASACCACHCSAGLTAFDVPSAQFNEDNKAAVGLQTAPLDLPGKWAVAMLPWCTCCAGSCDQRPGVTPAAGEDGLEGHTAASHDTLLRLESCERVFCSQTLAATPAPPAGARTASGR